MTAPLYLVAGGAGSGKSACAEALLCALSPQGARRVYLAAMRPEGAAERIARHRRARSGKGFETVERFTDIGAYLPPPGSAVLLEDLGNLCANELFDPAGAGEAAAEAIPNGLALLRERCSALVIVTNDCGAGGADYAGDTLRWLRLLGAVNCRLAAAADAVCEVAAGIELYHKGGPPCGL